MAEEADRGAAKLALWRPWRKACVAGASRAPFYANNRWLRRPGPWPGAGDVTDTGIQDLHGRGPGRLARRPDRATPAASQIEETVVPSTFLDHRRTQLSRTSFIPKIARLISFQLGEVGNLSLPHRFEGDRTCLNYLISPSLQNLLESSS